MKTTKLISAMMLLISMMSVISLSSCSEKDDDGGKKEAGSSNLRVTPGSLKFDAAGGMKTLTVTTTYEMFGVDTTADWLDYDYDEDTGLVYITATANNTDKARSTNLIVMGSDDGYTIKERVNIKVEQEAGTVDEGDAVFTVDSKGGKIEYGEISIDFPSGTFNSATKVTISEVEKGKMDGENEMSKFYKVKLSGGIRRNFKPAIKSNEFANDDVVKMMFISEAWAPSTNENGYAKKMANVAYANDAYYTEIPAMERPELADGAEVYFGLVYNKIDLNSSARTRDDNLEEGMDEDFILHGNFHSDLEKKIKECIRQALDKLKQLGIGAMKHEKINYYVEDFFVFSDAWGCYNKSKLWGPEAGSISLNQNKFPVVVGQILSFNFTELQKSIIHETMHYFQAYYYNNTSHNTGTILEEATAVWSERFYGNKLSTEYTVGNLPLFIASLNPEHGDVHWGGITEAGSPQWIFRYQNVGYGASALIEYLAQIFDDKIIDEMFDDRLERDDHLNTIGIIEKMAQKRGLDIFRQDNYKDFIEKLGCREVYSYKSKEPYVHFESMIQNRKVQDDIGVVTRIIRDQNPVYFTNYAYGYGALVEKLVVDGKNYTTISSNGLDNTIATIKQTTEGVKTWVYRLLKGNSFELLGMMEKGNTLDISYTFDSDPDAQYTYYLVTIPNDFKTSENILSRIEAKVIKEDDMIRIEPDKFEFDADGGSKYLDIYTKMPSFKHEKGKDWPSWLKVESYKDFTMKVTAEPNTSAERKATITVYALDAKGNKVGLPAKVEVTQKGKGGSTIREKLEMILESEYIYWVGIGFRATCSYSYQETGKKSEHGEEYYSGDIVPQYLSAKDMMSISFSGNSAIVVVNGQFHSLNMTIDNIDSDKGIITSLNYHYKNETSSHLYLDERILKASNIPLGYNQLYGEKQDGTVLDQFKTVNYRKSEDYIFNAEYLWGGKPDYAIGVYFGMNPITIDPNNPWDD